MGMSQAFAGPGDWLDPAGFQVNGTSRKYRVFYKTVDIVAPSPSQCYVMLDEHPDSINAGGFAKVGNHFLCHHSPLLRSPTVCVSGLAA
jgi:hypothetical protein